MVWNIPLKQGEYENSQKGKVGHEIKIMSENMQVHQGNDFRFYLKKN